MKTNKHIHIFAGVLLSAAMTVISCSKGLDTTSNPQETPEAISGYRLVVNVESEGTKALADPGDGTLLSTWSVGDSVSVYNVTTGRVIEGWLYAESEGSTTTLSGEIIGDFNLGDQLELTYMGEGTVYAQDGTLTGNETSIDHCSDFAIAEVEIESIDPEEGIIGTSDAAFVKLQSVVKFIIQDRKDPAAALKVKNLVVTVDGISTPYEVTPAAATSELYVSITSFSNRIMTLEAEGEDGFSYRLIMDAVSFENGKFYERTVRMKRKAVLQAPTAKTALVYNTGAQALVNAGHVVWTKTGNTEPVVLDTDKDKYDETCTIYYLVTTTTEKPAASAAGWSTTVPTKTNAGTYYVWSKMVGNYDYESVDVLDSYVTVTIAKATPAVTAPTAKSNLSYTGSSQTLINAGSTSGGTLQYKVGTGSWGTSLPSATNAGTYTVYYRVVGNSNYNDKAQASISVNVSKVNGYINVMSSTDLSYHDPYETKTITVSHHGGTLSYSKSGTYASSYQVSFSGNTVSIKWNSSEDPSGKQRPAYITITSGSTTNYNAATSTQIYCH